MSHATEPLPHWNDTAGATKGDVEAALAVVQLMEQYPGLRPIQRAIFFDTKAVLGAALHNPDATRQAFKSSTVYAKVSGLQVCQTFPEADQSYNLSFSACDRTITCQRIGTVGPHFELLIPRYAS